MLAWPHHRATCVAACLIVCGLFFAPESVGQILTTKTIAVKIFVDEEEPRRDELWKSVLARRLDQASVILSSHSSVRFSVTKFGTWDSDDTKREFNDSLKEFEQEARPDPAELAIGFTGQYQIKRGFSNLGGTRGPLRKHILLREGSPHVREVERLEVLVHELAHYLGAAHSPQSNSVMRPVLGDGQSRAKAFRIQLDEKNAGIVRLVSRELATRLSPLRSMHQLSIGTRTRVRDLYAQIAREFPEDEVAGRYALIMDRSIRISMAERQRRIQAAKAKAPAAK